MAVPAPVRVTPGDAQILPDGTVIVPLALDQAVHWLGASDFEFPSIEGYLLEVDDIEFEGGGTSYKLILYPPRRNWAKFSMSGAGEASQASDGTYQQLQVIRN